MSREGSTPEQRQLYIEVLRKSLVTGHEILKDGGEAMDAAVAAVGVMEDCPLFNCGKGAVFNVAGKNELEASIMLSKPPASARGDIPKSRRGFGLTLLTTMRNPARAARALYLSPTRGPHTFLSGSTAEEIAELLGEERVEPSYFFTETRWREHRRGLGLPEEPLPFPPEGRAFGEDEPEISLDQMPTGTVGAVALDSRGCIAAVTSTGGRTNKLVGRIGDTPHMGAGFWAEEWPLKSWWRKVLRKPTSKAVGISGTGDGDYFIRFNAAASIASRMKFNHESVGMAAAFVVKDLAVNDGLGGVIALDNEGNFALTLNSTGMYRGVIRHDGRPLTAIFDDDELQ